METIFAPNQPTRHRPSIFLAGTIDQGNSRDWQAELTRSLARLDVNVYNPRRPDWVRGWDTGSGPIHPELKRQIQLELT